MSRYFASSIAVCLLVLGGCKTPGSGSEAKSLDDVSFAHHKDGKWDVACKDGTHETVSHEDYVNQRVCEGAVIDTSMPVTFFGNDACTDAVTSLTMSTNLEFNAERCAAGPQNAQINAIRYDNGDCQDIKDQPFQAACAGFQGIPSVPTTVAFFSGDTCPSHDSMVVSLPFTFSAKTNDSICASVGNLTDTVKAVRWGATCFDIVDSPFAVACKGFRGAPTNQGTAQFFNSDACTNHDSEVGTVTFTRDAKANLDACKAGAFQGKTVKAFKLGAGECLDVKDSDLGAACAFYQAANNGPTTLQFFDGTNCQSHDSRIAMLTFGDNPEVNKAMCDGVASPAASVRSMKRGETCENFNLVSLFDACRQRI